jgi:XTP/dITP diphosphohydrolase
MKLYCATTNTGKLREFRRVIPNLEQFPDRDLAAPEETGSTFEENAILKAAYYGTHVDGVLFAEDSGLEVDALGGKPGIYSARYAGNDSENNSRVLRELQGLEQRTARFVCVIALVRGDFVLNTFRGEVEGEIAREPSGHEGFGYDPLFFYPALDRTFAELSAAEKLSVSHRGQALRKLAEFLQSSPGFPRPGSPVSDES